jgi:hypothetical protein
MESSGSFTNHPDSSREWLRMFLAVSDNIVWSNASNHSRGYFPGVIGSNDRVEP